MMNSGDRISFQSQVRRFMADVVQGLRDRSQKAAAIETSRADLYFEEVRLCNDIDVTQGPYLMPLVTLRTAACGWSRASGCTMCGYYLGSAEDITVCSEDLMRQTRWAIERLDSQLYHTLVFTSNGSFLDPVEVPDDIRPELLRALFGAGFQFIIIETRLPFVNAQRLDAMAEAMPKRAGKDGTPPLSISFGLESQSDFILDTCINKGINRIDIIDATTLIRKKGFSFDCYVLLGKLFMTAQEDVEDALASILWAHELGADYIFVMVTNRVSHSLPDYMISKGRYRLPSLWRAVQLLEALPTEMRQRVQIKGISHAPYEPMSYAETCQKCHHRVLQGLNFWNQTGDFEHIRELPRCECRDVFMRTEWSEKAEIILPERIHGHFAQLAEELGIEPGRAPSLKALTQFWQNTQCM